MCKQRTGVCAAKIFAQTHRSKIAHAMVVEPGFVFIGVFQQSDAYSEQSDGFFTGRLTAEAQQCFAEEVRRGGMIHFKIHDEFCAGRD